MIDFKNYEVVKLEDVADFERAKKDKVYPAGTSTLQISATRGQIGYLEAPGTVATKDVAIIPQAGINPRYFNIVLQKGVERFMQKYATGLNIREREVGNFEICLHNTDTQKAVAEMVMFSENQAEIIEAQIKQLKELKKNALANMFV